MKGSGSWNKRVFQSNRLTGCLKKFIFEVPVSVGLIASTKTSQALLEDSVSVRVEHGCLCF